MTISATTQGLRPGVCLSTNRPVNPFDGQVIYETDTDLVKAFNGTDFVTVGPAPAAGIEVVQASTAFTTSGTVNVNNVFETRFRYQVVTIDITAVSTTLQVLLRMRVGGVDNSASSYFMSMAAASFTSDAMVFGPRSYAASSFAITASNAATQRRIQLVFFKAAEAANTTVTGFQNETANGNVFYLGGIHAANPAFDGFSLVTSTGTITGTTSVSGFTA